MKYIFSTALILFGILSYSQTGWIPTSDSTEDNYYYPGPTIKMDTLQYVNQNYQDTIPKTQYREDANGVMTGYITNLRKAPQAVRNQETMPIYNIVREYYGQYYPNPGRTWVGWIGQ